jgi:hypothetical protein
MVITQMSQYQTEIESKYEKLLEEFTKLCSIKKTHKTERERRFKSLAREQEIKITDLNTKLQKTETELANLTSSRST